MSGPTDPEDDLVRRPSATPNEEPERGRLLSLADDFLAALASNDVSVAKAAHHVLGEHLERAEGNPRVVDLARERTRRRRTRR